ncbi:MAG: DUF917 domain-containing protein [Thermotoga caldifontis]|uniref:DUF917 domain-containing protein n=1 Tax=Thermotoga caldifontis TaxID=1508419 RepID=UPI003C7AC736
MVELTLNDVETILFGCAILGTGGGGDLQRGLETVRSAVRDRIILMSVDELSDDDLVACPYFVGSVSPRDVNETQRRVGSPVLESFKLLERYMEKKFSAVFPTELGGGNTAAAFEVAARLNVPVLDADPVGRAVPEVQHTSFYLLEIPMTPFTICNYLGDKVIVDEVCCDEQAEEITRAIAVVSGGKVGVTSHPLKGSVVRKSIVKGTVSLAWQVGRARQEALQKGEDPVKAIAGVLDAKILFEGVADSDAVWEDKAGFTYGDMFFTGVGNFAGRKFRIWFKNENLIAWLDGQVCLTCPDLIIVLRAEDGSPVLNPHLKKKEHVFVLGVAASELWRSQRAIEVFGPRHFGFDFDAVLLKKEEGR